MGASSVASPTAPGRRLPSVSSTAAFVVCSVLLTMCGLVAWISNGDGYAGCEHSNLLATNAARSCTSYQTTASWGLLLFLIGVVSFVAAALLLRRGERLVEADIMDKAPVLSGSLRSSISRESDSESAAGVRRPVQWQRAPSLR